MGLIRCSSGLHGTFAGIGNAQPGGNHQHFREDLIADGTHQHLGQMRIEGDLGHLPAIAGDPSGSIQREQIFEHLTAFTDESRGRRIDQREFLDRTQAERLHLQQDAGERGTLDLGRRVFGKIMILLLGLKMHTNTVPDTSAAAAALTRTGL